MSHMRSVRTSSGVCGGLEPLSASPIDIPVTSDQPGDLAAVRHEDGFELRGAEFSWKCLQLLRVGQHHGELRSIQDEAERRRSSENELDGFADREVIHHEVTVSHIEVGLTTVACPSSTEAVLGFAGDERLQGGNDRSSRSGWRIAERLREQRSSSRSIRTPEGLAVNPASAGCLVHQRDLDTFRRRRLVTAATVRPFCGCRASDLGPYSQSHGYPRTDRMTGPDHDVAPGWDAISDAMAAIHGQEEPRHWGAGATLPGGPGLYGLSAYDAGNHWHFVTLGISELWAKESDDLEVSGFGYELTMRTLRRGEEPPDWVVKLLGRLAGLTFQGTVFRPGHTLDAGGSIMGEATSDLTGLAFALDPQLGSISTPNGSLDFVQVVGTTGEELASIKEDRSVLVSRQATDPLLITDPDR